MQFCENLQIVRNKPRLEEQIFWRITGDGELGGEHDVRAFPRQVVVSSDDPSAITLEIANGRIDLSETDLHARQFQGMPPGNPSKGICLFARG